MKRMNKQIYNRRVLGHRVPSLENWGGGFNVNTFGVLSLFSLCHHRTTLWPALVLRCLQAIQLLIPDMRRHFQWRLPQKQHVLLTHFDHVSEVHIYMYTDMYIHRHVHVYTASHPAYSLLYMYCIYMIVHVDIKYMHAFI